MASGPDCWATATESTGGTCTQAAAQPEWGDGWAAPRASLPWSESATVCISHIPLYLLSIKANFMRGLQERHKAGSHGSESQSTTGECRACTAGLEPPLREEIKGSWGSSLPSLSAEWLPLLYAVGAAQQQCAHLSYSTGHIAAQVSPSSKWSHRKCKGMRFSAAFQIRSFLIQRGNFALCSLISSSCTELLPLYREETAMS